MTQAEPFAVLARRFCALVEAEPSAASLLRALAELRLAAMALEDPTDAPVPGPPTPPGPPPREAPLHLPFDLYACVWDPTDDSGDALAGLGSLYDDIADIRSEVEEGLRLHEGGQPAEALEAWRVSFWTHWGAHAVHAEAALHFVVARTERLRP